MNSTMLHRIVVLFVIVATLASGAYAAQLVVGETRAVVTEWTEPEVISSGPVGDDDDDDDGERRRSYRPSVPKTIEYRQFGTRLDADVGGTSVTYDQPSYVRPPTKFDVRLDNGEVITVEENEMFTIDRRRYRVVQRGMDVFVKSLESGRVLRLRPEQYDVRE